MGGTTFSDISRFYADKSVVRRTWSDARLESAIGGERKSNLGAFSSVNGLIADIRRGGPVGRIPLLIFDWVGDGPMPAIHAHVGLLSISVFKTSQPVAFSCRQVAFRLKQGRRFDVIVGKRGIPSKREAL